MPMNHTEIAIRGKVVRVPSAQIDGRTVVTTGKWLKIVAVQDEELVEAETVPNPKVFRCPNEGAWSERRHLHVRSETPTYDSETQISSRVG